MHALPSSHVAPLALGVATHLPVVTLHDPTVQASFIAEQSTGVPALHCNVCRLHASTPLQGLPSSQSALVWQGHGDLSTVQPPSFSEQVSIEQAMPSLHDCWMPPHLPALHVSACVQVSPSLQAVPSGLAGLEHCPVFSSQVPARWQLSCAVHATRLAGVQVPPLQVSPLVQGLPSLHGMPSALIGLVQLPLAVLHTPAS